jgi:CelD/BcsL family acetyltransferase involved in cellulose biosynthesis
VSYRLESVALADVPWAELDERNDRTIGQTRAWLEFLQESQGARPALAQVLDGSTAVGWFTGATVRRGGIRQLGSPLKGWTTAAMGFNLDDGASRTEAFAALPRFAFGELRCLHLELADRALTEDRAVPDDYAISHLPGYALDLAGRTDDDLMAAMTPYGRRDVRRALRNGIEIEAVDPADPTFVDDFHAWLRDAFAKRGLTATYPPERVASLLRHLGPTGDLLMLRARTPDGQPAAAGIFPGRAGGTVEFWGGSSDRSLQHLLPNEALMWHALRTWRDRGAERFDFGGGGRYKAKYGGRPQTLPWVRSSRFELLERARSLALDLRTRRRLGAAHPPQQS